jgi:hypothetical protein
MQTRWTAVMAALLIWPAGARAAPLDQAACDGLKSERSAMVAAGLEVDRNRGPEWARANLAPDRLKLIERMIAVDEQLSFRCGEPVTARPTMKEPPKPVQAAAVPANKEASAGQAATAASPPGDTVPAKKKKKPATTTNKAKSKNSAAAGSSLPSLGP